MREKRMEFFFPNERRSQALLMRIYLKKFGTTLISRQAGREAFAAFQPVLREIKPDEILEIDFEGVLTFSPSWGAEFLDPLVRGFGEGIVLMHTENPSVKATLELLEKINQKQFHKVP